MYFVQGDEALSYFSKTFYFLVCVFWDTVEENDGTVASR